MRPRYVQSMPETLCRLAIHATGPGEPATVDLVLPAELPVGELLPSVAEAVTGDSARHRHWYLTRASGARIDTSLSLRENAVQDGDMLVLSTVRVVPPRRLPTEPSGVVAAVAGTGSPVLGRRAVLAAGLVGTAVSAAALVRTGLISADTWPLWSAATLSATAATGSVAVGRTDQHASTLLYTAAVVFGTATAILAVPGAGWRATLLLSSAVALAMSLVLLRATAHGGVLTAFTASTGAMAVSAAVCVTLTARPEVAGAVLTVVALGALSVAPKLTVVVAGLGPSQAEVDEGRATAAHRTLTGLVAGWSASAALGATGVAATALHTGSSAMLAAVFAADLGILLLLRQRSHVDGHRRVWLSANGIAALLAATLVTVIASPAQGFWICTATTVVCGAGLRWAAGPEDLNPLVRQSIQVVEYLALAAVIPLAFWVAGLYSLVRDVSLP